VNDIGTDKSCLPVHQALLETGGQIDVIYTDLEKAFDKIPHKRLTSKLSSYGLNKDITGWIEAVLLNRKQRVRVKDTFSKWVPVWSGIPHEITVGANTIHYLHQRFSGTV